MKVYPIPKELKLNRRISIGRSGYAVGSTAKGFKINEGTYDEGWYVYFPNGEVGILQPRDAELL